MTPDPFPHMVIDGWFDPDLLSAVEAEFPDPDDWRWRRYSNEREGKLEGRSPMWGPATIDYFRQLASRADLLSTMSGIPDLVMETIGGGYHLIPPGGRLAVHTDFNRSPDTGLYRRLNVLTYLNRGWDDEGGLLQLGSPAVLEVVPEFGRTVIFATSDTSWHGHPIPAARWRKSVAAYFFAPTPPPGYRADHSTVFAEEADDAR